MQDTQTPAFAAQTGAGLATGYDGLEDVHDASTAKQGTVDDLLAAFESLGLLSVWIVEHDDGSVSRVAFQRCQRHPDTGVGGL